MSITHSAPSALETATWSLDPVHSSIGFAVKHNLIATFRGTFTDVSASLGPDGLRGAARVASVDVGEPQLKGHLQSPDFFDAAQFPELSFSSRSLDVEGDTVTIEGELTLKGVTRPVTLEGTISGPVTDAYGGSRLGLQLATTVNRHDFGISWNAPLPGGGFILADDVALTAELEFASGQ